MARSRKRFSAWERAAGQHVCRLWELDVRHAAVYDLHHPAQPVRGHQSAAALGGLGFGRIVALHYRSSTLYQIY